MNVLTLSRLFPNNARPNYGVFVANRLRLLAESGEAQFRILAPVAWQPFSVMYRRADGVAVEIPESEKWGMCVVEHPRYGVIPKLGFPIAPLLLYWSLSRHILKIQKKGYEFDLIDAQFFYPDGVAAALLGLRFSKPVVVTARGSDLNHQANLPVIGWMIRWALANIEWTVTVSAALKARAITLGAAKERVTVLPNGVDLDLFSFSQRIERRQELGLTKTTLLSIGNLIPLKGHDLVIKAMTRLADAQLLIIGEGPEKDRLRSLIHGLGLSERVRLMGGVPHRELPGYYSAADIVVLASSSEGWPNVVLEAMACGTPVIATNVGGVPEIITSKNAGLILDTRSPEAIVDAVQRLRIEPPTRDKVRAHAGQFDWARVVNGQITLYKQLANSARANSA